MERGWNPMIMKVDELRQYIQTDETDQGLALRLQALELAIQGYTHNTFYKYEKDGVIVYPEDIKMGVINLLRWDLDMREKTGVASETISRHSVSYQAYDGTNTVLSYPASLMGFLKPYKKARFGQGLIV